MTEQAFAGVKVLLIDGNNAMHRLYGAADTAALRTLLSPLRAAIPDTIATVLMLDGHADAATAGRQQVRQGFEIQHSGSLSGDDALLKLIGDTPANERIAMTIVSDDIALANRARLLGARTKRLIWLEQLIGSPRAKPVSIGAGRRAGQSAAKESAIDERPPWRPGRGATRKIGNPKRGRSRPGRAKGPR